MGRLDVQEMMAEMSNRDFAQWQAFFRLEPWGGLRDDFRFGTIAALMVNANPWAKDKKKRSDFFRTVKRIEGNAATPTKTVAQAVAEGLAWARARAK